MQGRSKCRSSFGLVKRTLFFGSRLSEFRSDDPSPDRIVRSKHRRVSPSQILQNRRRQAGARQEVRAAVPRVKGRGTGVVHSNEPQVSGRARCSNEENKAEPISRKFFTSKI